MLSKTVKYIAVIVTSVSLSAMSIASSCGTSYPHCNRECPYNKNNEVGQCGIFKSKYGSEYDYCVCNY